MVPVYALLQSSVSRHRALTPMPTESEHVHALKEAGTDQEKFNVAHERLAADKSMTNEHLGRIVKAYDPAHVIPGKSRGEHLKHIQQSFVRNARFEGKIKPTHRWT